MANTYGKVSGTFQEIQNAYAKVSGAWQEADEIYGKVSGVWKLVFSAFRATSFVTESSGSGTFTVPAQANAIHIQAAVGGGGGSIKGADYDKAGGESQGPGGGSGAFISDKVFSVTAGETISFSIGAGGNAPNSGNQFNLSADAGTNTTLSGSSAGALFTLGGGGGSSGLNGGVKGPLRTNTAGTAGTASGIATAITSGTFKNSSGTNVNVSSLNGGPVGTFNQSGNGAVGDITGNGNCNGDNCRIGGADGADSYSGNVAGGAGGSSSGSGTSGAAGTRGSGGGGGAAQVTGGRTNGGNGGNGEIQYRFIRVQ